MTNISGNGIPTEVVNRILDFLNSAVTPEDIVGNTSQPNTGTDTPDYNIEIVVAERILEKRENLGSFTDLSQLSDIKGFGIDKFIDLVNMFSPVLPSEPTTATSSLVNPAELFKFVSLRRPKRTQNKVNTVTIPTTDEIVSLYKKLFRFKDDPDAFNKIQAEVRSFKSDSRYIGDIKEYNQKLLGLSALIEYLKRNIDLPQIGAYTEQKAQELIGSITSESLEESALSDPFILWDNLFASLFSPVSPTLANSFSHGIATLNLLKKLNDTKSDESKNQLVRENFYARVLIPEWLYKIWYEGNSRQMSNSLRQTVKAKKSKTDELEDEWGSLKTIHRELEKWRDQNFLTISEKENKESELEVGTNNTIVNATLLKKPTKQFLINNFEILDNISIEKALRVTVSRMSSVAFTLTEDNAKKTMKIGSSIISKKDFCAALEDSDPCEGNDPKPFQWGGSFYSKIYWGDLIVTKQYLKNYDLGEVAHIESVLKGTEKERTHRRLKRTETSEYYETEITTESERETQTTERFEMEKETTKVVNQQMQFDAGVNTSGKYGLVNFEASVGFSYGSSSTQVSSEASSFSKEVTNRALNNVKETVRTSKSITILKEIEETAVHKIDNTDPTADNFNGVYRWVDKYYLNKVINYGGRLLMEFNIPEPANFYIFRKLNAPTEVDQLVKPTHPGKIPWATLNSFLDIEPWNYLFWTTHYGVSGALPPPKKYMLFGDAISLTYPANEKHDVSTTANIVIPAGYTLMKYRVTASFNGGSSSYRFKVQMGHVSIEGDSNNGGYDSQWGFISSNPIESFQDGEKIPVIVKCWSDEEPDHNIEIITNITFQCQLSSESLDAWRSDMYDQIMNGYYRQKEEYEDWVAAQSVYNQDLEIEGNNPVVNRQIEREETKNAVLK